VEPGAVIVLVDKGCHVCPQMLKVSIRGGGDLLPLECFQAALATGIVIRVRRAMFIIERAYRKAPTSLPHFKSD